MLLSELSETELKAALRELPRFTDATITTRPKLRDELAKVRYDGYALAVDELEVGLTAAAAPIRSAHGDIVASMSISGPTFRLDDERLDRDRPPARRRRHRGLPPPRLGQAQMTGTAGHGHPLQTLDVWRGHLFSGYDRCGMSNALRIAQLRQTCCG